MSAAGSSRAVRGPSGHPRGYGTPSVLGLDRTVHTATRLVILSALRHEGEAHFGRLAELTGVQRPNIAAQVRELEEAGLVEVRGKEADLRMRYARLSRKGRRCLDEHWRRLDEVRRGVPFRKARAAGDDEPGIGGGSFGT